MGLAEVKRGGADGDSKAMETQEGICLKLS